MRRRGWIVGVAAMAAAGLLGVAVGTSRDHDGAAPVHTGRLVQMEQSGDLHAMLQKHQDMMSRMQASLTPQMQEQMRADPMWQMLSSGELIRLMEEHQGDIDRMLAR